MMFFIFLGVLAYIYFGACLYATYGTINGFNIPPTSKTAIMIIGGWPLVYGVVGTLILMGKLS